MDFYNQLANYYDLIFPLQPQKEKFLLTKLNASASMLDVGCATGSLSLSLAEKGFAASAIDTNEKMVKIARDKAKLLKVDISFYTLNMLLVQQHFSAGQFNLICCLGNTLPHLPNEDSVLNFLRQAFSLLKKDGCLIIQTVNFDKLIADKTAYFPIKEGEDFIFSREYEYRDDHIIFSGNLFIKSQQKKLPVQTTLLKLTSGLLHKMLVDSGFKQVELIGDFSSNSYHRESPACIALAAK